MKLQTKIILIMISVWLIICTIVIADSKFVIAQDYKNLEKELIRHRLQDTERAFDRMLYSLSLYTLAWSQWDDAYEFMKVKSDKFIRSNFVTAIYRSSDLNFIMFFDNAGKLHYGKAYDPDANEIKPIPQALLDYLNKNKSFIKHTSVTSHKVGILQTKVGLIIMSSRPVTMSNAKPPLRGSILMGYYLDDKLFDTLSEIVGMRVQFFPTSHVLKDKQLEEVYLKLTSDGKYSIAIVKRKFEYGYFLLKDINNHPVGLLRVVIPRMVYQEWLWTTYHYIGIVLLSGLIIILLVWYLLKIFVLNRVLDINKQMVKINKERQFDEPITISGQDELTNMVYTINNMLKIISLSQSQLRYLATHDALTDLPNREHLYELLNQALENAEIKKNNVAVMFLDMDKLKSVNDHYGHAVGDKLIRMAASRVRKSLRGMDVVGRQSGDEFIAFLPDISDMNVVTMTAKRILQATSSPYVIDDIAIIITFSIGISIYPDDGVHTEELIKRADDVMYATKEKSGNSYEYYDSSIE